jgi:hypothetical protein
MRCLVLSLAVVPFIAVACTSGVTQYVVVGDGGTDAAPACTEDCGSTQNPPDTGTVPDTAGPTGTAVNPYGVPYPTDNLGFTARSGTRRGQRLPNSTFPGYRPNTTSLGTVSHAALYDPDGKTHDVVFIVCVGAWETYGKVTLDSIKASTKRIATFAVIGEGTSPGTPATLSDLSKLRTTNPWATTGLDSAFKVFGSAFDAAALPFVMVIDARTMEVSTAGVGGITTQSQVDDAVDAITSRPASY